MTVNINAANITSIRLAEQSSNPGTPASGFASLFVDANGDLATRKDAGGIKIATSPASGDWILTVDGTGTAARLNANQTFTGTNTFNQNVVLANGIGIDFSATSGTGTSELFDDYEEGTWTPAVAGVSTAGTASYTVQTGWYTKVGRLVTVNCRIDWANLSGTGDFQITGLPFTSWSTANSSTAGSAVTTNLNWSGGTQIVSYVEPNSSVVYFYNNADDAGAFQQCVNETTARIYLTHTYLTA